ncbi:MAG: hypothetical protein AAF810_02450 [Cyanobacteria bacterium P01_D01_bin.36]
MSGPSYFVRKGVSAAAQACGADPLTSAVVGRIAGTASSMVCHDHHTHLHTDPDEVAAFGGMAADHLREGANVHDLDLEVGDPVEVEHSSNAYGGTHDATVSTSDSGRTFMTSGNDVDVYVKSGPADHSPSGEWVDSTLISKK